MMPFSVLRIWGLGLFSWAILGLGAYCAFEAYEHFRLTPPAPRQDVGSSAENDPRPRAEDFLADAPASKDHDVELTQRAWALTAGAIACFAFSLGGFLPVTFFLSDSSAGDAPPPKPVNTLTVDRPDGTRLHVEIYGNVTRPTLLLTHGWSLDSSAWDYIKGELAANWRVVVWDLPGMGKSRGPTNRDYSLEKMAHDLDAVLTATATPAPTILLGHSIGGMILQTFHRVHRDRFDDRLRGMVLLFTTYTNPLRTNVAASLTTMLERPLIIPLNYLTIALSAWAWLSNWQSYLNGSLHCVTRFASFSGKQTRGQLDHAARLAAEAWPAAVARGNFAMIEFNGEPELPQIQVPVLVISGDNDRMTLPTAGDRMESRLPQGRPFRVASGHLGHWELATEVVQLVTEFAESLTADDAAGKARAKLSRSANSN